MRHLFPLIILSLAFLSIGCQSPLAINAAGGIASQRVGGDLNSAKVALEKTPADTGTAHAAVVDAISQMPLIDAALAAGEAAIKQNLVWSESWFGGKWWHFWEWILGSVILIGILIVVFIFFIGPLAPTFFAGAVSWLKTIGHVLSLGIFKVLGAIKMALASWKASKAIAPTAVEQAVTTQKISEIHAVVVAPPVQIGNPAPLPGS